MEIQSNNPENIATSTSIEPSTKYHMNVTMSPAIQDGTTTQSLISLNYNTYFLVYIVSIAGIILLQLGKAFAIAKVLRS